MNQRITFFFSIGLLAGCGSMSSVLPGYLPFSGAGTGTGDYELFDSKGGKGLYTGAYQDGMPNGQGQAVFKEEPGTCEGVFENGFNGNVTCSFNPANGEQVQFEGRISNGKLMNGKRSLIFLNDAGMKVVERKIGRFSNGKLEGRAVLGYIQKPSTDDGANYRPIAIFEGTFSNGNPRGNGVFKSPSGLVIEGEFDGLSIYDPPVKIYKVTTPTAEAKAEAAQFTAGSAQQAAKMRAYREQQSQQIAAADRARREEQDRRYQEEKARKRQARQENDAAMAAFVQMIPKAMDEGLKQQAQTNASYEKLHDDRMATVNAQLARNQRLSNAVPAGSGPNLATGDSSSDENDSATTTRATSEAYGLDEPASASSGSAAGPARINTASRAPLDSDRSSKCGMTGEYGAALEKARSNAVGCEGANRNRLRAEGDALCKGVEVKKGVTAFTKNCGKSIAHVKNGLASICGPAYDAQKSTQATYDRVCPRSDKPGIAAQE